MEKVKTIIYSILAIIMLVVAGCSGVETGETINQNIPNGDSPPPSEGIVDNELLDRDRREGSQSDEEVQQESLQQLIADGIYVESISYSTPPKVELIDVTIAIEGGIVTDISILGIDPHPTSLNLQRRSEEGLRDLMIGKKVEDIQIPDRVGGSSLTTKAIQQRFQEMKNNY